MARAPRTIDEYIDAAATGEATAPDDEAGVRRRWR
jgi:hypothetical protein